MTQSCFKKSLDRSKLLMRNAKFFESVKKLWNPSASTEQKYKSFQKLTYSEKFHIKIFKNTVCWKSIWSSLISATSITTARIWTLAEKNFLNFVKHRNYDWVWSFIGKKSWTSALVFIYFSKGFVSLEYTLKLFLMSKDNVFYCWLTESDWYQIWLNQFA